MKGLYSSILYSSFNETFSKIKQEELKTVPLKYKALTRLTLDYAGKDTELFYIVDGIDFDTIYSVVELFPESAKGFYSLNRIEEYETSGFGFIEQTNPLMASRFSLKRDKTLFIARYACSKIIDYVKSIMDLPSASSSAETTE